MTSDQIFQFGISFVIGFFAYIAGYRHGFNKGARWASQETARGILIGLNKKFGLWDENDEIQK